MGFSGPARGAKPKAQNAPRQSCAATSAQGITNAALPLLAPNLLEQIVNCTCNPFPRLRSPFSDRVGATD
jgi:hypothetical protein